MNTTGDQLVAWWPGGGLHTLCLFVAFFAVLVVCLGLAVKWAKEGFRHI